jgi:hypothetical protein
MGTADKRPHGRSFIDAPPWTSASSLRPGEIEALADRFSERRFEEMLRDREFLRLSDEERSALAAEFRRRALVARAEAKGDGPQGRGRATRWMRRSR